MSENKRKWKRTTGAARWCSSHNSAQKHSLKRAKYHPYLGRAMPQTDHSHSGAISCVEHVYDAFSHGLYHFLQNNQHFCIATSIRKKLKRGVI